jgi:hypothetical protein
MHVFVTSFIDLNQYEKRRDDKKTDQYIKNGIHLLSLPFSFIVFVDQYTKQTLLSHGLPNNVRLVDDHVERLDLPLSLPTHVSPYKDTYQYLWLINHKTEYMRKAAELENEITRMTWIDFGIFHIIPPHLYNDVSAYMLAISVSNAPLIRIPGCNHPSLYHPYDLKNNRHSPCWAFCGGLFSGAVNDIITFADHAREVCKQMIADGYITWEVNVWMEVYRKHPTLFDWYESDHTIKMLAHF